MDIFKPTLTNKQLSLMQPKQFKEIGVLTMSAFIEESVKQGLFQFKRTLELVLMEGPSDRPVGARKNEKGLVPLCQTVG